MTRRKRMLVICPYPLGVAPGQRLKFEQYYDDWRALDWEIAVSSYMDLPTWKVVWREGHLLAKAFGVLKGHLRRLRDLPRVHRYDLVYLHQWVTPFGSTLFERLARARAKALVYDMEDAAFFDSISGAERNPNRILRWLRGPGKVRYLIRTADHVVTTTAYSNTYCLAHNRRRACTVIGSSVDTDRFLPATLYSNERTPVIGWTGTHSTMIYLDLLRGVFQRLARRHKFRLRVIGNFDYELPGVDLEVVRWNAEDEVTQLQALDIGVYPLPLDEWAKSKAGLKAIQYMAFALPCVATDAGNTPNIIRHGETGLLVKSEVEWEAALEQLLHDPGLRRRLGTAARADAVARHSLQATAARYRAVIEDAVQAGG